MSSDFDPEATPPVKAPFVKKKGVNPTLSATNIAIEFSRIMNEIKLAGTFTGTKGETVDRLNHNVEQLGKIKALYMQVFAQHQDKLSEYNTGYKNSKNEFSTKMYKKKVDKESKILIELLQRMTLIDMSIKNIQGRRDKLLEPEVTEQPADVIEANA